MPATLKHAVIVCHPSAESFTMALARRYAQAARSHGQEVAIRDLYRIGFDPVMSAPERSGAISADVSRELSLLEGTEVFVLVYPIWFGTPPAMLKGYIDRVFGAGRVLGRGQAECGPALLRGKHLVSLTLSGGSRTWLAEKGVLGSLRNLFDRYLAEVFALASTYHYHFDEVRPGLPERDYRFHLARVDEAVANVLTQIGRQRTQVAR